MTLLVLSVVVAITVGSYVFYFVMFAYAPAHLAPAGAWMPSGPEWGWIVLSTLSAVVLAVFAAAKLSRRILAPLTSVAGSLRRVSNGDLSARATSDDRSLGEASLLVEDFNLMAERLDRMAQEQVFWNAAIAHELRTPITILRGRMQGLAEGVFEPSEKLFRNLLAQVENLGRLIEDLRVVGLADSGHLTLQVERCDLAAGIRDVLALTEPDLRAKGLLPELRLQEGVVECDPARMRQALLALLENARCHAAPGRLEIALAWGDGECRLSVTDSGPGIDPAFASKLFDAFQRGDAARLQGGSGSGLGLAVVRAIALAHGGQARCHAAGGGTCFELAWPDRG
ncbi:ATP-binding protein [Massilia arenae]|uniref:histidine kinase n=1 Tax=Massilia arenae TaxID=2603288 RepID=A0A5C7G850_9BURK|nr:ATP-binding protein [Massilia arenae]TXG02115.1 HAMP domain-containing histidine kinase [Massilia arenae]